MFISLKMKFFSLLKNKNIRKSILRFNFNQIALFNKIVTIWALRAPARAGSTPVFRSQSVIARNETIFLKRLFRF